jgi:hypothetical protein
MKSGECPSVNYNNTQCLPFKISNCIYDDDCVDDLKCCSNGCNFLCTKPCPPVECSCKDKGAIQFEVDSNGCKTCRCLADASKLNITLTSEVDVCLSECEAKCRVPMQIPDKNVCNLPVERGPCKALISRFHFDASTQTCKQFFYGGCQGNGNNFDSQLQCETMCKKILTTQAPINEENACKEPLEIGQCKAQIKRFYFDQATSTCKQFFYSGCKGNNNNFETLAKCEKQCKKSEFEEPDRSICQLRPDQGPCMALVPRFFYDKASGSCLKFQYGGCLGNLNNFETLSSCEAKCKNIPQPREIKKFEA